MGYKAYSDSYLMSLTKAQIIELLRTAEHNFFVTEEALNNSSKAGMEIAEKYDKAKELLKLAVEDINFAYFCFQAACKNVKCEVRCPYYKKDIKACDMGWRYYKEALKLLSDEKINNV